MQKDVAYTGIELNRNEYDAADGSLGIAFNVINEEHSLEALPYPKKVEDVTLGSTEELVCVHRSVEFGEHRIVYDNKSRALRVSGASSPFATLSSDLKQIVALGNTLVAMTEDNKEYFLWSSRETDGEDVANYYSYGSKVDFLDMGFSLTLEAHKGDVFLSNVGASTQTAELDDDDATSLGQTVFGQIAKEVREAHEDGYFVFPFFVRYALRLFDGSLVNHSAPILMFAANRNPIHANEMWIGGKYGGTINFIKSKLVGTFNSSEYATAFKNKWKDIVQSVDIFVSEPLYGIDMAGKISKVTIPTSVAEGEELMKDQFSIGKLNSVYTKNLLKDALNLTTTPDFYRFELPENESFNENVRNNSRFYLLHSIPLGSEEYDEYSSLKEIATHKVLNTIREQELMVDDYHSADDIKSEGMFIYNQRLHLYNIKRKVAQNISVFNAFQLVASTFQPIEATITISLRKGTKKNVVSRSITDFTFDRDFCGIRYLFFPDVDAYKASIEINQAPARIVYELELSKHPFLNGSYWYANGEMAIPTTSPMPALTDTWINEPNKIYTSSVGYPFSFPLAGINTLGVGEIVGLAAASQEMSQGQYGQFPLYCFATDGIWAMSVDASTGLYSARTPITSKIAIPGTVTSADATVMFATEDGVYALNGNKTQELTDPLDGVFPSHRTTLADRFVAPVLVGWRDYVKGLRMAYDGKRERLYMFNKEYGYYYVLSLKTNLYTMAEGCISSVVNVAPDCFVNATINGQYGLYNLAESSSVYPKGYVCTRPFRFGANTLLSVNDIIQRGVFLDKTNVAVVIKGTRDFVNWVTVGSSTNNVIRKPMGSPFRAYRMELFLSMGSGESLSGWSCNVEQRRTNHLR